MKHQQTLQSQYNTHFLMLVTFSAPFFIQYFLLPKKEGGELLNYFLLLNIRRTTITIAIANISPMTVTSVIGN